MYLQSDPPIPPKNYSGNAFLPNGQRRFPTAEPPPSDQPPDGGSAQPPEAPALHDAPAEAAAVEAIAEKGSESHPVGGLASRFPFLSSLLPPRRERGERSLLPDWVLLGAMVLLLLADEENDILPLLLLLLLWD